jgi:hypothetical protein
VRRVDAGERIIAEDQHPAALAWERLVTADEAMTAAKAAKSRQLYYQAVELVERRARQFSLAIAAFLEELGE